MSTSSDRPGPGPTLVLGVGNPLMGDDGLGPAALARLLQEWSLPPEISWRDGGTGGLEILPEIEQAERVLVIDAIDVGAAPGADVVLERHELPRCCGLRISPHEVGLRDLLALAELRGRLPSQAAALGLQPGRIALPPGLSDEVEGRLPDLVRRVAERLAAWGHALSPVSGRAERLRAKARQAK
jgi:hydrogenase maturation protease